VAPEAPRLSRQVVRLTTSLVAKRVTAPMTAPVTEMSSPMIQFCTALKAPEGLAAGRFGIGRCSALSAGKGKRRAVCSAGLRGLLLARDNKEDVR
jgi:hypothetical protein